MEEGEPLNCDWGEIPKYTIEINVLDSPGDRPGVGPGRASLAKFIVHDNEISESYESPEVKNDDFHAVSLQPGYIEVTSWAGVKIMYKAHGWQLRPVSELLLELATQQRFLFVLAFLPSLRQFILTSST